MKINSFFKAPADGTNGRGYLLPALRFGGKNLSSLQGIAGKQRDLILWIFR